MAHIFIAEKALGRTLPTDAVVHHVDGDIKNFTPRNLVICQDQAYHLLLHLRARALRACGNLTSRKCSFCKKYDDPGKMAAGTNRSFYHRACKHAWNFARHVGERTKNCWNETDDAAVLDPFDDDAELSIRLKRSIQAIRHRRCRLKVKVAS